MVNTVVITSAMQNSKLDAPDPERVGKGIVQPADYFGFMRKLLQMKVVHFCKLLQESVRLRDNSLLWARAKTV